MFSLVGGIFLLAVVSFNIFIIITYLKKENENE